MFPQLLLIISIILLLLRFVVVALTLASFWCIMGGKGGAWLCDKFNCTPIVWISPLHVHHHLWDEDEEK